MAKSTAREPAIRMVMMPRDTNHMGSIFGGHILSLIDLAAGQHARSIAPKKYVTKVMREVEFIAPVQVGDSVSFYAKTKKVGTTSVTVTVDVEVLRGLHQIEKIRVTSAEVVMVCVNDKNKPVPILKKGR
jgi:acyl-CoA thioesterase YciA